MVAYFAYGSNMNVAQLCRRCPSAKLVEIGFLNGYKLDFTVYSRGWRGGAADVVTSPNDSVWGVVFELDYSDLQTLDRHEGYPHHYTRFEAEISARSGGISAWIYSVVKKESFVPPTARYINMIREAAARHGLPDAYQKMLAKVSSVDPDAA